MDRKEARQILKASPFYDRLTKPEKTVLINEFIQNITGPPRIKTNDKESN